MTLRTTPLGFIPGSLDLQSHCLLTYRERNEAFIRAVTDYLAAGINAGEMCVCVVDEPTRSEIAKRMSEMGIDMNSGQLQIPNHSEVYIHNEVVDLRWTLRYWHEKAEEAKRRWRGLRAFGDRGSMVGDRALRMKIIAYEAQLNANFQANIGMCGYNSAIHPRNHIQQAQQVHPFLADVRSIKRNNNFTPTEKFLAGFYRYRCISRVYEATEAGLKEAKHKFEELAARSPLSLEQIPSMKFSLEAAFRRMMECLANAKGTTRHIHINFSSCADGFSIRLRVRAADCCPETPDSDCEAAVREQLSTLPVDKVEVGYQNGYWVITLGINCEDELSL